MIRVERIAASTLNEIQRLVATAEQDASETKLVVLDLRMSNVDNLHNLNVFADGILGYQRGLHIPWMGNTVASR